VAYISTNKNQRDLIINVTIFCIVTLSLSSEYKLNTASTKFLLAVESRDCHPRIPNPGIPAVFANPESWDWRRPNPWISGLQKLVEIILFCTSNDRNKNFSLAVNKIYYLY